MREEKLELHDELDSRKSGPVAMGKNYSIDEVELLPREEVIKALETRQTELKEQYANLKTQEEIIK